MDLCQTQTVSAAADCSGVVALASLPASLASAMPPLAPVIGAPTMAKGFFRLSFPTSNGKLYTVQYKNALSDPVWTDLKTVEGTGGSLSIADVTAAQQPRRFFRVMSAPR